MTDKINYIETDNAGDTYRRAKAVILSNPREHIKSVEFVLEDLTNKSDGTYAKEHVGSVIFSLTQENLKTKLNLINPTDGSSLGTKNIEVALQETFVLLYSLLLHTQTMNESHENESHEVDV